MSGVWNPTERDMEVMRERVKRWKDANPEKARQHRRDYKRRQRQTAKGKEIHNIEKQQRRAKQRQLEASFTHQQWEECKSFFNFKCAYCGEGSELTQEHFIPVCRGGEYSRDNIIPICKHCNSSKNYQDFFIWYPQ